MVKNKINKNFNLIIMGGIIVILLLFQTMDKSGKKMVGEVTRSFSDTTIPPGGGEITITYDGGGAEGGQYSIVEPVPAGWSHVSGPGQVTEGVYRLSAASPKNMWL